jgi:hypothetical protein
MFSSFWRRPTVALTLVLAILIPVSLIGIQSATYGAQPKGSWSGPTTPNPTCKSAFSGQKLCITATPTGLKFKWTGYTFNAKKPGCKVDCLWSEGVSIFGDDIRYSRIFSVEWSGATYTKFVPLKTPEEYNGSASIGNPGSFYGVSVNFRLVVPQVGTSNLAIKFVTMPGGKLGQKFLYRFTVTGGKPPYRWIRIVSKICQLPKGLDFYTTGPKAGTISGIPLQTGYFNVPVIVRDKVGHSAYMLTNWLIVTS